MRYHAAREKSVTGETGASEVLLIGRNVVDATICGERGMWNLQHEMNCARKGQKWVATKAVATTF